MLWILRNSFNKNPNNSDKINRIMRFYLSAFLIFFCLSSGRALSLSQECASALQSLFAEEVSQEEAGEFLKVQGEITLHRLAWAYLKAQKSDQDDRVQSTERTIIELLNDKYTNTDPDFIKAREAFESQPLSRAALADIAPYLKEALSAIYPDTDNNFKLNQSDLKLLAAIARQERATAVSGKFDHRMLSGNSPQGMLNFTKLINSAYKTVPTQTETDLNIELKLTGLENVMAGMQARIGTFLNQMEVPTVCHGQEECNPDTATADFFKSNEDVQKIFWESLAEKLESDDILLEKLSYGDIWLKVKGNPVVKPQQVVPVTGRPETPRERPFTANLPVRKPELRIPSPTVTSINGVIIEDPTGIIVRDQNGRNRAAWEKFDKPFQEAMARAILGDEKVFQHDGKLYDRRTGRQLVPEFALNQLPPKKQEEARIALAKVDVKLKVPMVEAIVNGNQTFISSSRLYDLEGRALNQALIISDVMTKKTGVQHEASRYQGMDNNFLVIRANALKNNQPTFTVGNQTMNSLTGRNIASPFRNPGGVDTKLDKTRRRIYENLSDGELIRNFHRDRPNPDCNHYGVIDKKKAQLKIYANAGGEVYSSEVLVGADSSDQRTRWTQYSESNRVASASTGAGIFTIRPQDMNDSFNKRHFNNNILSFKEEKNANTVFAIHQVPVNLTSRYAKFGTNNPDDRRVSGGCANLKLADFTAIKKWLGPACKVYVLPEEPGNKFVMQDNQLKLISTAPVAANRTNLYNFSSTDTKPAKIDIKIVNQTGNTQQAKEFVKALEDEKAKLMGIYKLSNDEYNDLATLAYGILGNESEFGNSTRLKVKENAQFAVIMARFVRDGNVEEAKNTSRGLTQIKFLPGGAFKQHYAEVTKENLMNPRNSAVATMGYLAEAARQMRQIAIDNKSDTSKLRITRENMMDYMGYLYQGNKRSLSSTDVSRQATPEFNGYYRNLQRHMSYIEISQKIE